MSVFQTSLVFFKTFNKNSAQNTSRQQWSVFGWFPPAAYIIYEQLLKCISLCNFVTSDIWPVLAVKDPTKTQLKLIKNSPFCTVELFQPAEFEVWSWTLLVTKFDRAKFKFKKLNGLFVWNESIIVPQTHWKIKVNFFVANFRKEWNIKKYFENFFFMIHVFYLHEKCQVWYFSPSSFFLSK